MAGRSDIEAGKAHVKLSVDNSPVAKWLKTFGGQMRSAGTMIMGLGGAAMGAGLGIVGGLGGAVKQFAAMGTELEHVSQRTGVATSSLAEMKYAAETVGGSLGDVESALGAMRGKFLDPSKFDQYAASVAAIENPTLRAARANEIFGSAGEKLLPMLGKMGRLRQEARDLGLVPTDEAVADAAEIGKAFNSMKSAATASIFEIGAAITPVLKPGIEILKSMAGATNRWIRENAGVVRSIAMIGAGLIAAGAAVGIIGAAIFALGSAGGIAATVVGAIGTAAAFIASPLGIVLAAILAIGAGVIAWVKYTKSGKAAFQELLDFAAPLLETLKTTVGGVFDALKAGDILLAGQIAIKGLQVLFFEGFAAITEMIGGQFGDTFGTIGRKILGGDFKGAFQTALKQMLSWGASFVEGIVALFTQGARMAAKVWQDAVNSITDFLLDASAKGGAVGAIATGILGVDMKDQNAKSALAAQQRQSVGRRLIEGAISTQQQNLASAEATGDEKGANEARRAIANFTKDLEGLGRPEESAVEGAKAAAREQTQSIVDGITKLIDSVDTKMQGISDAADDALKNDTAGGADKFRDEITRLKEELAALRNQAGEAAKAAEVRAKKAKEGDVAGGVVAAARSAATFSAAGALAMGNGGPSRMERIAEQHKNLAQRQLAEQEKQNKKLDDLNDNLGMA